MWYRVFPRAEAWPLTDRSGSRMLSDTTEIPAETLQTFQTPKKQSLWGSEGVYQSKPLAKA